MGAGELTISIVIPTLNAGRGFGTALHRILGQGRVPLEILVVDAGSQDGTRHIVNQFPAARFVEAGVHLGPRAWNQACKLAKADVVVFLGQQAVPSDGDWLNQLMAPLEDPAVAAVYGRLRTSAASDPLGAYRIGLRFPGEAQRRRARFGDPVDHQSLGFAIENAALRRSVWRGIHFNEHVFAGGDRVWARQVLLASCTLAYAPDATVDVTIRPSLREAFHQALLTGWTDEFQAYDGGTLRIDGERFARSAAWHLVKRFRWDRLPYLALEEAARRYGYGLGRRLHRLAPSLRTRMAPELEQEEAHRPLTEREKAA